MKNLNIIGIHWKIQFLGGGCWTVCIFKGGLAKKRGVFLRQGWYPNTHYVIIHAILIVLYIFFCSQFIGWFSFIYKEAICYFKLLLLCYYWYIHWSWYVIGMLIVYFTIYILFVFINTINLCCYKNINTQILHSSKLLFSFFTCKPQNFC